MKEKIIRIYKVVLFSTALASSQGMYAPQATLPVAFPVSDVMPVDNARTGIDLEDFDISLDGASLPASNKIKGNEHRLLKLIYNDASKGESPDKVMSTFGSYFANFSKSKSDNEKELEKEAKINKIVENDLYKKSISGLDHLKADIKVFEKRKDETQNNKVLEERIDWLLEIANQAKENLYNKLLLEEMKKVIDELSIYTIDNIIAELNNRLVQAKYDKLGFEQEIYKELIKVYKPIYEKYEQIKKDNGYDIVKSVQAVENIERKSLYSSQKKIYNNVLNELKKEEILYSSLQKDDQLLQEEIDELIKSRQGNVVSALNHAKEELRLLENQERSERRGTVRHNKLVRDIENQKKKIKKIEAKSNQISIDNQAAQDIIDRLLDQHDNNPSLALGAYNAEKAKEENAYVREKVEQDLKLLEKYEHEADNKFSGLLQNFKDDSQLALLEAERYLSILQSEKNSNKQHEKNIIIQLNLIKKLKKRFQEDEVKAVIAMNNLLKKHHDNVEAAYRELEKKIYPTSLGSFVGLSNKPESKATPLEKLTFQKIKEKYDKSQGVLNSASSLQSEVSVAQAMSSFQNANNLEEALSAFNGIIDAILVSSGSKKRFTDLDPVKKQMLANILIDHKNEINNVMLDVTMPYEVKAQRKKEIASNMIEEAFKLVLVDLTNISYEAFMSRDPFTIGLDYALNKLIGPMPAGVSFNQNDERFQAYKTLGLSQGANLEQIRTAYKNLTLRHHPDRGGNAAQFVKIHDAYCLLNPTDNNCGLDNNQQYEFNQNDPYFNYGNNQYAPRRSAAFGG